MIGFLRGKILYRDDNFVIVGENVGYQVYCKTENIQIGDEVDFWIHTVVRENEISLWGFLSQRDLEVFKLLITVSGVGPRSAGQLIFALGSDSLIKSISRGDTASIKIPGVGSKTAGKIILDLRSKFEDFEIEDREIQDIDINMYRTVIMALESLGYREVNLKEVVKEIILNNPDIIKEEDIIKKVLQNM